MKKRVKTDQLRRAQTGSTSSGGRSVFSYHSAGNRVSSATTEPRIKKSSVNRLTRYHWRYLPSAIALLGILISIIYVSSISPNPKLVLVEQNDGPSLLRDRHDYQQAAQKILSNSLADKSKITVDSDGFSKDMKDQFPELIDVAITLPLMGRRPIVEIVAAQPILKLSTQNETYLVDVNGRVLVRANENASYANLKIPEVNDQSGVKAEVGKGIIPGDSVAFITTFINQLKFQKLIIEKLTLPAKASELHVKIKDIPYYIKTNLQTDPRVAAGQFLAVKQKLEAENKVPKEYIDVRVEEKVFVK